MIPQGRVLKRERERERERESERERGGGGGKTVNEFTVKQAISPAPDISYVQLDD